MPGEDKLNRPMILGNTISSDDIEPPTSITDPKLRKKMKRLSVSDASGGSGESSVANSDDNDDDEEEERGRPRTTDSGPNLKEGNQGLTGNQNFIFMGDFVDRGYFSLETLSLLLCLKAR